MDRLFTYRCPKDLAIQPGSHVLVPFGGGNRPREGFVLELSQDCPAGIVPKDVLRLIEPYPVLLPDQIKLAYWLKASYNCLLVDALRLMIPSVLRGGRVTEKVIRTVRLSPEIPPEEMLSSLLKKDGTPRSPKQHEIIRFLMQSNQPWSVPDLEAYLPGARNAVAALIQKGFLVEEGHVTFRSPMAAAWGQDRSVTLTKMQQDACNAVSAALGRHETFLLHGVTGSGKTEVYMHCIEACLSLGQSAMLLVPEIALTPQAVALFRARFSDRIAVLHSKLSDGERFDEWRRIRLGRASVVIGARSAVFAPLENMGLIIIDEEHEPSYQSEITPRYHAVDVARRRAALLEIPVLLGSATPQLISYFRAVNGQYHLLSLPERVNRRPLPEVSIIDMREEFLLGNNGIFSTELISRLTECFAAGHQAMLFQNRRGYSTFVSCRACGHVMECPNCDLSLTYHKRENHLACHFCGEREPLPGKCPSCGKPFIKTFGVGTEQIEEQARALFPGVSILRMDTDTVRGKNDLQEMLSRFGRGEAQLLIGTQMIAKGHDFPNVTLVGVIAADSTLRFPDYRSAERTFQLLTQVSGRAGRADSPGRVVIQTYTPGHPVIQYAKEHDYEGFFNYELNERKKAVFPPYSLYLRILVSGPEEAPLNALVQDWRAGLETDLTNLLAQHYQRDVLMLTASPAPVKKKNREYRYQILIKLLRTEHTGAIIRAVYAFTQAHRGEAFAAVEVNPQDML
ncbi:MAG: primosomal protein N' [Clostridia bacterium]|nr:primosomal protein N' [Clostridia bacterium]